MKCPACANTLVATKVGEITVDVCKNGCGGLWFDNYELKRVDERHEVAGEALLQFEKNPGVSVDYTKKRPCPKCNGVTMMKHFMSIKRDVEVDECGNCGGFWLDAGELGQIRNQFKTEADRTKAAEGFFDDAFGEELEKMLEESQEKADRAGSIAKMFRFLLPSYYIPGKQKWGAF